MEQSKRAFTEDEIKETVNSCQDIILWLTDTSLSVDIKYKQMDDNVRSLMIIECIFAYLYTEVSKYGNIADIIDTRNEIYARYTLAASLVFSEPKAMQKCLCKLPTTWTNIMGFVKGLTSSEEIRKVESLNQCMNTIDKSIKELSNMQIIHVKDNVWC